MHDKLHLIKESSGFQATVSLQKGSEFHTVFLVVFVPFCYVTHCSVVTALWGMLRVLSRTPPLGFHGQSHLPCTSAAECKNGQWVRLV